MSVFSLVFKKKKKSELTLTNTAVYGSRKLLFRSFDASLSHQIGNALFQIIYSGAHIINACYNLIGHRLEFVLDILQKILNLRVGNRKLKQSALAQRINKHKWSALAYSLDRHCWSTNSFAQHHCRFPILTPS